MPKKILLADDSVTIQKVVELTFAEGDYEVTCVSNGRAAVDRLKAIRPDILLCDIIMPELSGYEVAEFVKKDPAFKGIPVILLTGTFEPFDEDKARMSGADTYITKPFDSRMLVEKVESLLQQRLVMSTAPHTQVMELLPGQGQSMTVMPPPPPVETLQAALDQASQEQATPFTAAPAPPAPATAAPPPAFGEYSEGAFKDAALPDAPPATPEGAFAFGSADASPFETSAPLVAPIAAAPPAPEPPPAPAPQAFTPPPVPAVMDFGDFQPSPPQESAFESAQIEEPVSATEPPLPPDAAPERPVSVEPDSPVWSPLDEVSHEAAAEAVFAGSEPPFPEMAGEVSPAQAVVAESVHEGASEEPELPPFAGQESQVVAEVSSSIPPFVEKEGPEPELERAVWDGTVGAAEPVLPVTGLIHDMTDQQEMVAEAQAYEAPATEAELAAAAPEEPSQLAEVLADTAPETDAAWGEEAFGSEEPPVEPVAAPVCEATTPVAAATPAVDMAQVEEIVRKVIAEIAPDLVRQVAWEVIPELAESLIKRRIQELESQVE